MGKQKKSTGTRYTDAQKKTVVDFVQKRGRGGIAAAQKKYGISYVAIRRWIGPTNDKKTETHSTNHAPSSALIQAEVRRQMAPFLEANKRFREGIKALIKAV